MIFFRLIIIDLPIDILKLETIFVVKKNFDFNRIVDCLPLAQLLIQNSFERIEHHDIDLSQNVYSDRSIPAVQSQNRIQLASDPNLKS